MTIEIPADLANRMYSSFSEIGEIQANGLALLKEVTVSLDGFKVTIRPNESQHRGRPHCSISMNEISATFDIATGAVIVGSLKSWTRTAEKVVRRHSADLTAIWERTRPDDQKLNQK